MKHTNLAVMGACVLLAGCAQPVLLKHYKVRDTSIEANLPMPSLTLSVFPASVKSPDPTPVVLQLAEKAQAELVKAIAERTPASGPNASANLLTAVLATAKPNVAACGFADKTWQTKRLNITLLGQMPLPADRVDRLEITLVPKDAAPIKFTSWDRFESAYFSYSFGSATYTQTTKLTAGSSRTDTDKFPSDAGSLAKVLSVGAENTNALAETASYAMRRMSVGGALTEGRATLVQEGAPLSNLFGTSTATLTFALRNPESENWWVHQVTADRDGATAPKDAVVQRCQVKALKEAREIAILVSAKALVRQVRGGEGDDTVIESDDRAYYREIEVPPQALSVPLLSAADTTFETFGLRVCGKKEDCTDLAVDSQDVTTGEFEPLQFTSYSEANTFRLWLLARSKLDGSIDKLGGDRAIGLLKPLGAACTTDGSKLCPVTPTLAGKIFVASLCSNDQGQACTTLVPNVKVPKKPTKP